MRPTSQGQRHYPSAGTVSVRAVATIIDVGIAAGIRRDILLRAADATDTDLGDPDSTDAWVAMTTDPTMRVVWFDGRPFPVSSHPGGLEDSGTHWYVQTEDGGWHAVLPRRLGDTEGDGWRRVVAAVGAWLEKRTTRDA